VRAGRSISPARTYSRKREKLEKKSPVRAGLLLTHTAQRGRGLGRADRWRKAELSIGEENAVIFAANSIARPLALSIAHLFEFAK
jgi:hypothetical protein